MTGRSRRTPERGVPGHTGAALPERRGPSVKFCGLTRAEDAAEGGRLGARHLGAIFAGGPRLVAPARAAALFSAGRAAAALSWQGVPRCVGVFGAQTPAQIADVADVASLDVLQLHSDPTPADVARIRDATGREVWAVLRVSGSDLPPDAAELFAAADAVVLDARVPGALGGTGVALDWARLAESVERARGDGVLVLAGGLTPSNVAAAASLLAPSVVDVSSGVEASPGIKDHHLMREFWRAATHAAGGPAERNLLS